MRKAVLLFTVIVAFASPLQPQVLISAPSGAADACGDRQVFDIDPPTSMMTWGEDPEYARAAIVGGIAECVPTDSASADIMFAVDLDFYFSQPTLIDQLAEAYRRDLDMSPSEAAQMAQRSVDSRRIPIGGVVLVEVISERGVTLRQDTLRYELRPTSPEDEPARMSLSGSFRELSVEFVRRIGMLHASFIPQR